MWFGRTIIALLVFSFVFGANSARSVYSSESASGGEFVALAIPEPTPVIIKEKDMSTDIKTLAESQRGGLKELFIAVAYDAERYQSLRGLSPQLPEVDADVFKTNAVVAVFLGQRSTGGYGIKIEPAVDGGITISETRPEPGTMVQQVLSAPFKVVSVPVTERHSLDISLEPGMNFNAHRYRVVSGDFTEAGGFAPRRIKFGLTGGFTLFRDGTFVSILFDLRTTGGDKPRVLRTLATGTVDAQGKMQFPLVDANSLIETASTPTKAVAASSKIGLSVNFSSAWPVPPDGIYGEGEIEAQYTPVK